MIETRAPDPRTMRYREASEWLLRLKEPGSTEQEVDEWLRWCERDHENLTAFERLQQDWSDTEGFKGAPELLDQPCRGGVTRNHLRQIRAWARYRWQWAGAAAVLLAVLIGYVYRPPPAVHEVISTFNQRAATLPDGSSLLLSAKAAAQLDFTQRSRRIALPADADAYIKVHHDAARPFIVSAGPMTVTAVGTAFDVKREGGRVTVTVEEGTIVARAMGAEGPEEWRVSAGHRLDYSDDRHGAVVAAVDAAAALSWRGGELSYEDVAFETVIADVNRYAAVNIVIRDPAVARLRFTGTVFVNSVSDWIKALEIQYPVRTNLGPDGRITLELRDPSPR